MSSLVSFNGCKFYRSVDWSSSSRLPPPSLSFVLNMVISIVSLLLGRTHSHFPSSPKCHTMCDECSLSSYSSSSLCIISFNWSKLFVRPDSSVIEIRHFQIPMMLRFNGVFHTVNRIAGSAHNSIIYLNPTGRKSDRHPIKPTPPKAKTALCSSIASPLYLRSRMPRTYIQTATAHHAHTTDSKTEDKDLPRPSR